MCLGGNARYTTAHRTVQANKVSGEVETRFEVLMAPKMLHLNIVKNYNVAGLSLEFERVASWSARLVANVIGVKKPPWMDMHQWRQWHRTGHRWIEKCNMNVVSAIRERALSWAGHVARMDYKEMCAKALRCRGLQWWRWRQLHWKEVEKDKWSGPHPQRFKIYRWEDMVSAEVSKFTGDADGSAESVQMSTGWLQLAQDQWRWRQFTKFGKSPVLV